MNPDIPSAAAPTAPGTVDRTGTRLRSRPSPGRDRTHGREPERRRGQVGGREYLDQDRGHIIANFILSFVALLLGGLYGPLQALDKMGVNLYPYLPGVYGSYYLGLTLHGVGLALLFTFTFIIGFLSFAVVHGLRRPLVSRRLGWAAFLTPLAGTVLALVPLLRNDATVLWTFYAPLRAHPGFYAGLVLAVTGTYLAALNGYLTWRAWKREHPEERTPLMAFASLATWTMWVLASVGLAYALVAHFLPWSLNENAQVNALLTRSLFWFTGHPVVYFWLLPAYVSWYTMLPAQVGGRLFSESLARLVFLLFLPLSIPTGLHHMFSDPGITHNAKLVHSVITFGVVMPSLLTAFTVVASLEDGARRNGGKGWLRWILALPWFTNPSVAGQLLAMLLFAGGGITGLINASYTMNLVVHNSMWVAGHLHFQVGTASTLTFMSIAYWLVPVLTRRTLWRPRLALWQVWLWFVGMAVMGRGMHWMGLGGAPRRTFMSMAPYADFDTWWTAGLLTGIGGLLLTVAGVMFLWIMAGTLIRSERATEPPTVPEARPLLPVERMPKVLDRLTPWVVLTVILTAFAWLPTLIRVAQQNPLVPGWRLW